MFVVHVTANAALSSLILNTLTAWCMVYNVTKTVSTLLFFFISTDFLPATSLSPFQT